MNEQTGKTANGDTTVQISREELTDTEALELQLRRERITSAGLAVALARSTLDTAVERERAAKVVLAEFEQRLAAAVLARRPSPAPAEPTPPAPIELAPVMRNRGQRRRDASLAKSARS